MQWRLHRVRNYQQLPTAAVLTNGGVGDYPGSLASAPTYQLRGGDTYSTTQILAALQLFQRMEALVTVPVIWHLRLSANTVWIPTLQLRSRDTSSSYLHLRRLVSQRAMVATLCPEFT